MSDEKTGSRRGEPMVRRRGEMLEPAGIFAGVKLPECQCYEGSLGCLGPPCVTEAPQRMEPEDIEEFDREMRKAADSVALDSSLAGWSP